MAETLSVDTPIASIAGIGPRFIEKLKKLGILTVRDLLFHFPARYEDFSKIYSIAELEPGQQATIQGVVEEIDSRRTWAKHMTIVEAVIADETGSIRAIWFNQPYVKNALKPGARANFSGKISVSDGELYLSHPTYELVGRAETKHTARLVPIYPETYGLTSKGLRFLIQPILRELPPLPEFIPQDVLANYHLQNINQALKNIHFPNTPESAFAARERFAFENLFLLQIANLTQKMSLAKKGAPRLISDMEWLKGIIAGLPFELTFTQKKSLWEIIQDIDKPRPMNRLLQGDVGSGKTVVAALAALIAKKNRAQAAIMAPTEVLAVQHFETFRELFKSVRPEDQPVLALFTAGNIKILYENDFEASIKKISLLTKLANGEIDILIGTHALIAKSKRASPTFKNLGIVVIDEQHRFGIRQRAALTVGRQTPAANRNDKRQTTNAQQKMLPHFLSMSATPIPRTLMLTIFGDLDLSLITELPKGRAQTATKIIAPEERQKTYNFIRVKIRQGRQAFVICPRIEPAENNQQSIINNQYAKKLELKSVKEEYEKLSKKVFPELKLAMLHGQMKSAEKEKIMRDFKDHKIDMLVSTSVIEVGVDVPNAVIMAIEGAERFGLAQLYQFRGRVGRGEHESFCFLFTDSASRTVNVRLKAILAAKNGFELAEMDLEIRGPGEFLGKEQTGLPDIAMENLKNAGLVKQTRDAAVLTLKTSPTLAKFPELKIRLKNFERQIHLE